MYGLLIVTLLSLTIGSISTEIENVAMEPAQFDLLSTLTYTGNFCQPFRKLDVIQICGKARLNDRYIVIIIQDSNGNKLNVTMPINTHYITSNPAVENSTLDYEDTTENVSENSNSSPYPLPANTADENSALDYEETTETVSGNANASPYLLPDFYFNLYVMPMGNELYVDVNKKQRIFVEYFSKPFEHISKITVSGAEVSYVAQQTLLPGLNPTCVTLNCASPSLPFRTYFPALLKPGQIITIIGKPNGSRGQFSVNFVGNNNVNKILFHFNPRFVENKIVLNSMNDNLSWEKAVQLSLTPFRLNEKFKLVFGLTSTSFKFAANGVNIGTFNYRQNNIFELLNGFFIDQNYGVQFSISSVDYLQTGSPNLDNIVGYSRF